MSRDGSTHQTTSNSIKAQIPNFVQLYPPPLSSANLLINMWRIFRHCRFASVDIRNATLSRPVLLNPFTLSIFSSSRGTIQNGGLVPLPRFSTHDNKINQVSAHVNPEIGGSNCGSKDNSLLDVVATKIRHNGPMTVSEYMRSCLIHPEFGYYMKRDVFGSAGDFVTAPEVSQVFGELIAIWCASLYLKLVQVWGKQGTGESKRIDLIELGPGRGTLMKDFLRAAFKLTSLDWAPKIHVHMVEVSSALKKIQQQNLKSFMDDGVSFEWYKSFEEIPSSRSTTTFVIAQEFFDALPVHQFTRNVSSSSSENCKTTEEIVKSSFSQPRLSLIYPPGSAQKVKELNQVTTYNATSQPWREKLISVSPDTMSSQKQSPNLEFIASSGPTMASAMFLNKKAPFYKIFNENSSGAHPQQSNTATSNPILQTGDNDDVKAIKSNDTVSTNLLDHLENIEICPEGISLIQKISQRIVDGGKGGAALIIDYGQENPGKHTVRALKNHQFLDSFLQSPGDADVTADVDFGTLLRVVKRYPYPSPSYDVQKPSYDSYHSRVRAFGPVTQGDFLHSMGISERLSLLAKAQNFDVKVMNDLKASYERLCSPKQMGSIYKVMAVTSDIPSEPPGFEKKEYV